MKPEKNRYSRQIKLKEVGEKKQSQLPQKKIIIVGCGGLGSAAAELLLRAGVENITLIDQDKIELTNLGRQLLYDEKDINKHKAVAAKEKLLRINSQANIVVKNDFLTRKNISILKQADLVLDCTDNLETRFWINAYCYKHKIPWIYASAIRWEGYVMLIQPGGPCLSCFLKKGSPENCNQQGIISPLPTAMAALQATLALRFLFGEKVESLLYRLDLKNMKLIEMKVKKNIKCLTCSH
ncbi:MAG: HesA/MoeB/ThiF family protein [Candidatus Woesearchaeota archaeon]